MLFIKHNFGCAGHRVGLLRNIGEGGRQETLGNRAITVVFLDHNAITLPPYKETIALCVGRMAPRSRQTEKGRSERFHAGRDVFMAHNYLFLRCKELAFYQ